MSLKKAVAWSVIPWIGLVSSLHAWLNLDLFRETAESHRQFKVGFLPVT